MYKNIQKLKKKFDFLRNYFLIKPTIFSEPKLKNASLSDFFFFDCREGRDTKITVLNLYSQINPDELSEDNVEIFIFDYKGRLLKKLNFVLKFNEYKEIIFSKYDTYTYGSFFIFHSSINNFEIESKGSYPSERGYVGYRKKESLWNFVHGNRTCNYISDGKIKSIMAHSLFKTVYTPQVNFNDTNYFKLIFNNPLKHKIKIKIKCFDSNNKIILSTNEKIVSYGTKIIPFKNNNIKYIKIYSRLIFCRPLIHKEYEKFFDIFHA